MNKNKITFRTILVITIILTMMQMLTVNVYAVQGTFSVSASSSSIEVGGSTTVNVSANNCGGKFTISSSNSSVASVSSSKEWVENESASITVTGKAAGSTTITVTADDVANSDSSGSVTGSRSVTINVKAKEVVQQPADNSGSSSNSESSTTTKNTIPTETTKPATEQKSSNNYLKSLSIGTGSLSPAFYRGTLEYTATFPDDVDVSTLETIKVNATTESSKASIKGTGNITLAEGDNNLSVDVTAEDGSTRTYIIKVTKPTKITQSDLRLESLEVNKINSEGQIIKGSLDKEFSTDNFNYTMNVEKDIISLDITTKVAKEGIIVTVKGDKDLVGGENTVTITLTSEKDSTVQTVYTIKANKEQEAIAQVTETNPKSSLEFSYKMIPIIIGGGILLLFIILIILLIINHKQQKNKKNSKENVSIQNEKNDGNEEIKFNDYVSKITNTEIPAENKEDNNSLKFDDNIINNLKTSIITESKENNLNNNEDDVGNSIDNISKNNKTEEEQVKDSQDDENQIKEEKKEYDSEKQNEEKNVKDEEKRHRGKHF